MGNSYLGIFWEGQWFLKGMCGQASSEEVGLSELCLFLIAEKSRRVVQEIPDFTKKRAETSGKNEGQWH